MSSKRLQWPALALPPLFAALSVPLTLSLLVALGSDSSGSGLFALILLSAGMLPWSVPIAYLLFGALLLIARARRLALRDVEGHIVITAALLASVATWLCALAIVFGRVEWSALLAGLVSGIAGAWSFLLLRRQLSASESVASS